MQRRKTRGELIRFMALCLVLIPCLMQEGAAEATGAPERRWLGTADGSSTVSVQQLLGMPGEGPLEPITEPRYPSARYPVQFVTEDGVRIGATFVPTPRRREAPVVVLLHALEGGSRRDYEEFTGLLAEHGFSSLALDLRGYGESTQRTDGSTLLAKDFEQAPRTPVWEQMQLDVRAGLDWLGANRLTTGGGTYLMGTGVGAAFAVRGVVKEGTRVRGAVLVSPPLQFREFRPSEEIAEIQGRPFLVIVGLQERTSIAALQKLSENNPTVEPEYVEGQAYGYPILRIPKAQGRIIEFLNRRSGLEPVAPPPPS